MNQQKHKLNTQITKQVNMDYLLYLPEGYQENNEDKWPLILFLHGMGERGTDIEKIKKHGLTKMIEQSTLPISEFPFIVVSPQCPEHSFWFAEIETLQALLDDITMRYSVDEHRIYLTGLSMGGYGTWHLATAHPERFAAIAPICGGGIPEKASALKEIPVWAFHGAKDDVVPIAQSENMVSALKEIDANIRFTIYPDADHDSWTETYQNPELYRWFLEHSKT